MIVGCLSHLLVAKIGAYVLCMLVAAVGASLVISLRSLIAQRVGGFEQVWSLYRSVREQRMILRAGETGYQAAAVRAAVVSLLYWCQLAVVGRLLRRLEREHECLQSRLGAEAVAILCLAAPALATCPAVAGVTARRAPGSGPCRLPD